MFSQWFPIPSGYSFSSCPLNDIPSPRSSPSCHSLLICLHGDRPTRCVNGKEDSQGQVQVSPTCWHMTLTWCPGMSPGRPRSFPILEKCSATHSSFFQTVTPQCPFAPYISPLSVLTWQQFNGSCTIFSHVCYQISSYTKFLFFQCLIRLKVQILHDNRRIQQI